MSRTSFETIIYPLKQEAIERKVISDKGGHYDWKDSQSKHLSERGFLGMSPTMAAQLGEVCVETQGNYLEGD